jgi:hypothetical protein
LKATAKVVVVPGGECGPTFDLSTAEVSHRGGPVHAEALGKLLDAGASPVRGDQFVHFRCA